MIQLHVADMHDKHSNSCANIAMNYCKTVLAYRRTAPERSQTKLNSRDTLSLPRSLQDIRVVRVAWLHSNRQILQNVLHRVIHVRITRTAKRRAVRA